MILDCGSGSGTILPMALPRIVMTTSSPLFSHFAIREKWFRRSRTVALFIVRLYVSRKILSICEYARRGGRSHRPSRAVAYVRQTKRRCDWLLRGEGARPRAPRTGLCCGNTLTHDQVCDGLREPRIAGIRSLPRVGSGSCLAAAGRHRSPFFHRLMKKYG